MKGNLLSAQCKSFIQSFYTYFYEEYYKILKAIVCPFEQYRNTQ